MRSISIPWRPLLLMACLTLGICAQASTGCGKIKITWSTESECALTEQAQSINIDLFQYDRLVTSVCAQRPTDSAESIVTISDIDTGRYLFQATAIGPIPDCGIANGIIGRAWGFFDVEGSRTRTIRLTVQRDEDICLSIEPRRPVINPGYNTTRHLYVFAQNSDGSTVLLPPQFVWSTANRRQAEVDPHTGVVTGWVPEGNVRITVVNTATKLRANTLVLVRDWIDML